MGEDTIPAQEATEAQPYAAQQGIPPQEPYGVSSVQIPQEPQMAMSQGQVLTYPIATQYPQQLPQYPGYPMPSPLPLWERKACKVCAAALLVFFLDCLFYVVIEIAIGIIGWLSNVYYSSMTSTLSSAIALIWAVVAAISAVVIIVSGIVTFVSKQ